MRFLSLFTIYLIALAWNSIPCVAQYPHNSNAPFWRIYDPTAPFDVSMHEPSSTVYLPSYAFFYYPECKRNRIATITQSANEGQRYWASFDRDGFIQQLKSYSNGQLTLNNYEYDKWKKKITLQILGARDTTKLVFFFNGQYALDSVVQAGRSNIKWIRSYDSIGRLTQTMVIEAGRQPIRSEQYTYEKLNTNFFSHRVIHLPDTLNSLFENEMNRFLIPPFDSITLRTYVHSQYSDWTYKEYFIYRENVAVNYFHSFKSTHSSSNIKWFIKAIDKSSGDRMNISHSGLHWGHAMTLLQMDFTDISVYRPGASRMCSQHTSFSPNYGGTDRDTPRTMEGECFANGLVKKYCVNEHECVQFSYTFWKK